MMKTIILTFFLFVTSLTSAPSNLCLGPALENDPLILVEGMVNALTGDFILQSDELAIVGKETFPLSRTYISRDWKNEWGGWMLAPQTILHLKGKRGKKNKVHYPSLTVRNEKGALFSYKKGGGESYFLHVPFHFNSCISEEISAATYLKNQSLERRNSSLFVLIAPDQTKRFYQKAFQKNDDLFFLLNEEILPNGNRLNYSYDQDHRLIRIILTNADKNQQFAWVNFIYHTKPKKGCNFTAHTSDGRSIEYIFLKKKNEHNEKCYFLQRVSGAGFDDEVLSYTSVAPSLPQLVQKQTFASGKKVEVAYYPTPTQAQSSSGKKGKVAYYPTPTQAQSSSGKVATITITEEGKPRTLHFTYRKNKLQQGKRLDSQSIGQTEVSFSSGEKRIYHYSSSILNKVEQYSSNGHLDHVLQMQWNENGQLIKKTMLNSKRQLIWATSFDYDLRGNIIHSTLGGDLSGDNRYETYTTTIEYDVLDRPVQVKEENGKVLVITYQGLSRSVDKVQMKVNGQIVSLANPHTFEIPEEGDKSYNARGQVTHVVYEDGTEELFRYHLDGTIKEKTSREGIRFVYETNNGGQFLSEEILKPNGSSERYVYDEKGLIHEHIDSSGTKTCFERDPKGRPTQVEIFSSKGESVQVTRYFYENDYLKSLIDPAGRTHYFAVDGEGRFLSETIEAGEKQREVHYTYDKKGRMLSKSYGPVITQYHYEGDALVEIADTDLEGNLLTVEAPPPENASQPDPLPPEEELLPSGITVYRVYDPLHRLTELYTSDGTVHYSLQYNALGLPIRQIDHIEQKQSLLIYDEFGMLLEETFLNGQTVRSAYDEWGRRIEFTLPDESKILTKWGPKFVKEIRRVSAEDNFDYVHTFIAYDLSGFPIQQQLPEEFGELTYIFEEDRQLKSMDAPLLPSAAFSWTDEDPQKTVNVEKCTFDGLGRLKTAIVNGRQIAFTYDVWNRLMSKTVVDDEDGWFMPVHLAYLYDGGKDIGAMDIAENWLKQLRILAPHPINFGDQAIAYELEGKPYIPVFDEKHNPTTLVSTIRRKVMESYIFQEKGAEKIADVWGNLLLHSKASNPWLWQSNRYDPHLHHYYIGPHFYNPQTGNVLEEP